MVSCDFIHSEFDADHYLLVGHEAADMEHAHAPIDLAAIVQEQPREAKARQKQRFDAQVRLFVDRLSPDNSVFVETTATDLPHKLAPVASERRSTQRHQLALRQCY